MQFWRIAGTKWALDRSCEGTRIHGGRWNPPGTTALYGGTTVEICALEKFVHLEGVRHPPLVLVSIDIPDDPGLVHQARLQDLPADWAELPVSNGAQKFGQKWLVAGRHLALLVPSAIVPEATNVMINPMHAAFGKLKLKVVREFRFDQRMSGQA